MPIPSTAIPLRELTAHRTNSVNSRLRIFEKDVSKATGMPCEYLLCVPASTEKWGDPDEPTSDAQQVFESLEHAREDSGTRVAGSLAFIANADTTVWPTGVPGEMLEYVEEYDAARTYGGGGPAIAYNVTKIVFQDGPERVVGCNGVTQEALLALPLDRCESVQDGKHKNHDNQVLLDHLNVIRMLMFKRTLDHISREGKAG